MSQLRIFALMAAALWSTAAARERPNIIFMFSDDHTWQAVGAYNGFVSSVNPTPNIDRLASEGMLFRNAFVTNSICAPSRAVVLTGKYSHRNGVPDNIVEFDGAQQTFPKLLRNAGYQTAMIGKWHLKSEPTGFDHWEVLIGQGPYYDPPMRTPEGVVSHSGYTTEVIADLVHDWLENKRDPDRPFLLMYQHKASHSSFTPGPNQLTRYAGVEIPEPPTLFDDYEGRGSAAKMASCTIEFHLQPSTLSLTGPPESLNPAQRELWNRTYEPENRRLREGNLDREARIRWRYQRYIKNYLRTVAGIDDSVGRLMK
ncbi:MAG: sulfatase-like hydrolase/transferase, partial [bacterium]|nr:sulfatase-like hydrolase/transferase [bacterium]